MSLRILFFSSLIASLLVQGTLWRFVRIIDQDPWMRRIEYLESKYLEPFREPLYANPNAPLLFIGAAAHRLGVPTGASLYGSMSILISLAAAGIITTAYVLRPDIPWWLASGAIILSHHLYIRSAPQDAIVAPLITLMVLLVLFLHKHPNGHYSIMFLGLAQGAALATRMDISAVWIMGTIVYLSLWLSWKTIVRILVVTIASFFLLDPFMWFMPISHIMTIASQISQHILFIQRPETSMLSFYYFAPYTSISILLTVFFLLFQRKHNSPLPSAFALFLLAMTIIIPSLILQAQFNTFRYFYSLIFVWDALLPLFLLHYISFLSVSGISRALQQTFAKAAQYAIVAIFFASSILMHIYIYYLPAMEVSVDWSQFTFTHTRLQ